MARRKIIGKQGGVFTLVREIGRGGFGIVYLAEDEQKHQYAVKIIAPVWDPTAQQSFEQEVQSTLGLSHENLLAVIDYGSCRVGSANGLFAVTMYCPDGDYRATISKGMSGDRPLGVILAEFRQILAGLIALHSRVIHRDLKPENILVAGGVLKVGDFGLAKFVDEATRTLTFKGSGTPRYMAPEVWLMQRATPATDLYAVGVMLFEAVTGQPPFVAPDANALRSMHLYTPAPRAKAINKDLSESLDGVIKKLLEKDPAQRFQSVAQVLATLDSQPSASEPLVANIANRMRQHHDAEEAKRLEAQRRTQEEQDTAARNRYKEQEVIALLDEVVAEVNAHLAETKIEQVSVAGGKEYRFGRRILRLHFFAHGELYRDPEVPGRMETLRKCHAVHGGYIEIKEGSEDREGWNLVLVRSPDSLYGEWKIVESRVSPLVGYRSRYEPVAGEARLFADNLACHWGHTMHTWVLKDKPLERADIIKIMEVFIPNP